MSYPSPLELEQQRQRRPERSYERAFDRWRERFAFWLRGERGRCSTLAKELGVRRQTLWRWAFCSYSKFPGWGAVACNALYYRAVPRDVDDLLKEQQKFGPLEMKPLRVSPQADKVVSTESDKFVRRSADNEDLEEAF